MFIFGLDLISSLFRRILACTTVKPPISTPETLVPFAKTNSPLSFVIATVGFVSEVVVSCCALLLLGETTPWTTNTNTTQSTTATPIIKPTIAFLFLGFFASSLTSSTISGSLVISTNSSVGLLLEGFVSFFSSCFLFSFFSLCSTFFSLYSGFFSSLCSGFVAFLLISTWSGSFFSDFSFLGCSSFLP